MTDQPSRGRMVILLIAGLPLTMILAATWLWVYVSSGSIDLVDMLGTANRGTLVEPPRSLSELALRNADGVPVELPAAMEPKWTLLIPSTGSCDVPCEEVLYYTRQIRTAMGKYMGRIDLAYIAPLGSPHLSAELLEQHPLLKVVYTPAPALEQLFAGAEQPPRVPAYYLVDPAGWVMMYYTADDDGKKVMADLKFLLKNSEG